METGGLVVGRFFCSSCNLNLNSQNQLDQHMSSRRHKVQQKGPPHAANHYQGKPGGGGVHLHRCDLCDVNLNSAAQLNMHLASKRHRSAERGYPHGQGPPAEVKHPPLGTTSENGKVEVAGPGQTGIAFANEESEPFWKDSISHVSEWTSGGCDAFTQQPLRRYGQAGNKTSSMNTPTDTKPKLAQAPVMLKKQAPESNSVSQSTSTSSQSTVTKSSQSTGTMSSQSTSTKTSGGLNAATGNSKTSGNSNSTPQAGQTALPTGNRKSRRGAYSARRGSRSQPLVYAGRSRPYDFLPAGGGPAWQDSLDQREEERYRLAREPWEGGSRGPWREERWIPDRQPLEERQWADDRFQESPGSWFSIDRKSQYHGDEMPPRMDERLDRGWERERYSRPHPPVPVERTFEGRYHREFDYHHGGAVSGGHVFEY